MKTRASWGIFLAILASSSAFAIPNLGAGSPGCMRMILERPMLEATAMKLKPECRDLRAAYLGSLDLFARNPERFRKELDPEIRSGESDGGYRAVLMAAIFEELSLVPALEARAKKESKARHAYATAALERLKTGNCSSRFQSAPYDEVCRLASPPARRLRELNQAK